MRSMHIAAVMCALTLAIALAACESTPKSSVAPPSASPQPAATESVAPTVEEPHAELRTGVKDLLANMFDPGSIKISFDGAVMTIKASTVGLADTVSIAQAAESAPDGWADKIAEYEAVGAELSSAAEADGVKNTVLYVISDQDAKTIFVTITNGKCSFNLFDLVEIKPDNPPTISKAEYDKISTGMTYQEVVDIIGSPGEVFVQADNPLSDFKTTIYMWEGEGALGANANITFMDGEVDTKAQFGLE